MYFSQYKIQHYRSFRTVQTVKFGIPKEGVPGSGISYIVGENNSGKTTLIEGLFLRNSAKIRTSERQADPPVFELYDTDNQLVRKIELIRENSYTLKENPQLHLDHSFEFIHSRRHWNSNVSGTGNRESFLKQTMNTQPRNSSFNEVSGILRDIELSDDYDKFVKYVQRVIPRFSSYAIGYEDNEYIEYITKNGIKHKSDYLGDGVISILRILSHLFVDKKKPIVIDEPELSLHPLAQKRLLQLIAESACKRQIIIATHSPYLIDWEYIKNGASVNKVIKPNDEFSEVYSLKDYSDYKNLIEAGSWQQPFLMDVVAKEILFHDNFLFAEGQEDVGLLKAAGDLKDEVNLFGYGVRGKNNFKLALRLATDLGVQKVCALLDNGESETAIKIALESEFPNYTIIQWDRADIRDKEALPAINEKIGYFDKNGKKKEDLGDYDAKIGAINRYFS